MNLKLLYFIPLFIIVTACSNQGKQEQSAIEKPVEIKEENNGKYPAKVWEVFKAHGGLNNWKQFQTLEFQLGDTKEKMQNHCVDLWSRKSVFKGPGYAVGNDGTNVWVHEDTAKYKGNAAFYYNLMFYFYAMPFVLGDDGITYTELEPVTLLDKQYNAFKISYSSNVGESPDDEYIIYSDPKTNKMEWLAYTVTFFSKEKAKRFSLIKYEDWEQAGEFVLPKKLQWYKFEDGVVGEKRGNPSIFKNLKVSKEAADLAMFTMPEGGNVVK